MLKKISISLLFAFICSSQVAVCDARQQTPEVIRVVSESPEGRQMDITGEWSDSGEEDYVQESELARKMEQAQKAENAKTYDSYGGGITIIAMCIVIGALVVLSLLFYLFGSVSSWFLSHKKKKTHKVKNTETEASGDLSPAETFAAIAAALTQHFSHDHDMEDTILTIRRMRKAYSPWNSKIYNMRPTPEVPHHPVKIGK